MKPTQVTIEAMASAPVEKVWDAWTNPEHIVKWNFASEDWQCPSASNDLRVGGTYKARMEAKDGSFGFDFEAVYQEVIPHQRISYVMADGRVATTTFENLGSSTKVITIFEAESENSVEMQQQGWQAILNNFVKHVSKQ